MKRIILFLVCIIVIGCNNDDQNVLDYSNYFSENSIDHDINFMPVETYGYLQPPQLPSLKLKLSTVTEFGCFNYEIGTTEFINGNELIIRFDEIINPGMCQYAVGEAKSYVDLPQNTDKITFINGNIIDKYEVVINITSVSITPIENNFTHLLHSKTFRFPENSFAVVSGTNTDNVYIRNEFLAILNQNLNFTEFVFEGEGRIPYPETTMGHGVNHPTKYFKYSNTAHFYELASILNSYSEDIDQTAGASIVIHGWNNIKYYSYIQN